MASTGRRLRFRFDSTRVRESKRLSPSVLRPLRFSEASPEQSSEVPDDLGPQREGETWGTDNKFTPALKPPFTSQAAATFKIGALKSVAFFCVRDSMTYRSQPTANLGDRICPQSLPLADLRPSPAPAPTLREGVNVLLTRMEEIQKVHTHVFARLADAQEDHVLADSSAGDLVVMVAVFRRLCPLRVSW